MLYIMRHGRTAWNAAHRLQGKTDVPLSEEGRETAAEAGERYRDTHFDVCFCSPLIRARKTAALLLWGRDVPLVEDARLEEMGFGVCEGTSDFDKNPESPIYPLFHAPETYGTPAEGGESLAALFERTGAFLKEAVEPQLRQAGVRVGYRVKDDYTILAMVESGLGISVLPHLLLQRTSYRVHAARLMPPVARRMGILLPKEGYVSLAARQFVSFLRQEAEAVEK